MTQMITTASGTMGALNAVVGLTKALNPNVSAFVSGTFVGTISLQAIPNGNSGVGWVTIGSLTAPGTISVPNMAGDLSFQLIMSSYTSGSALAYLASCPSS